MKMLSNIEQTMLENVVFLIGIFFYKHLLGIRREEKLYNFHLFAARFRRIFVRYAFMPSESFDFMILSSSPISASIFSI